jgi:hypothetical protein
MARGDLNGHIGTARRGFEKVHESFGYDETKPRGRRNHEFHCSLRPRGSEHLI